MKKFSPNLAALNKISLADEIALLEYCSGSIMAMQPGMERLQAKKDDNFLLNADEIKIYNEGLKEIRELKEISKFLQGRIDHVLSDIFVWEEVEDLPTAPPQSN